MVSQSLSVVLLAASILIPDALARGSADRFIERHEKARAVKANRVAESFSRKIVKRDNSTMRYLTETTQPYVVDSLPEVDFDIGEMYSGLIPIDSNDTSRQLFFIFQPTIAEPVDEVTIWLNGGPGCSSMEGFFQENGRFLWQPGVFKPTENPYSWVNLTNMLWIDQPIGTGFSANGKVTANGEEDIAQDFVRWFKNWQTTFGIQNYKIYITGESYAGRYVPYIGAAMLDQNDPTYYNVSGALVYDPVIGDDYGTDVTAFQFLESNNNVLGINSTYYNTLAAADKSCGYAAYRDQYLTFPPPGNQPHVNLSAETDECDIFDGIYSATSVVNPCFDVYEVNLQCPILWDVLSFPTGLVQDQTNGDPGTYFNRTDVKTALHANLTLDWEECGGPVFLRRDMSVPSAIKVLPQVIEATNRVLVSHGDLDMILITNGTLLAIQNMTWNGALGFQSKPETPIDVQLPDLQYGQLYVDNDAAGQDGPGQGIMGIQHFERGLMWAETYLSGHMQPQFQPRVTYRHLQWVLGRIDTL